MLLCLDIGNTHILCGVYNGDNLVLRFRHATNQIGTSDQFGIFLLNILQANNITPAQISDIAMCSVVASVNFSINHALQRYFKAEIFVLEAGVKTGLHIKYKNPAEVGADRIAGAIAASNAYPDQNIISVDMGTATTFDVITKNGDYLGGAIMPGMRVAMQSLTANTSKLLDVDITVQNEFLGRTTRESIQKGLYFGQLGSLKEIIAGLRTEQFKNEPVVTIGTGGFTQLFKDAGIFGVILPDLVLSGLKIAHSYALKKDAQIKQLQAS